MAQPGGELNLSHRLPIQVSAALDIVALVASASCGPIRGTVIGDHRLTSEPNRYGHVVSDERVISLFAAPDEIARAVSGGTAREVIVVRSGEFERLIRPLRTRSTNAGRALVSGPASAISANGYRLVERWGIQGIGSVGWAIAERLVRRFGRPDLADRCRIAMLRTLIAGRPLRIGAIRVERFNRISR